MTEHPKPMRLMVIGAHPDDAEFHAGGLMSRWTAAGHELMILCLTDGAAGHHQLDPQSLKSIRQNEAYAAARLLDAEVNIWPVADGELEPTVALRHKLIATIRRYAPDLIVTHRSADYHPDHRAAAQLVQDASYLLQVPNIVPEHPPLVTVPPVLLAWDRFTYPRAFRADWVLDTSAVVDRVVDLLDCHASQVYEWLPHTQKLNVPDGDRLVWLKTWYVQRPAHIAKQYAPEQVNYAEAYEISEYAGRFDATLFSLPAQP